MTLKRKQQGCGTWPVCYSDMKQLGYFDKCDIGNLVYIVWPAFPTWWQVGAVLLSKSLLEPNSHFHTSHCDIQQFQSDPLLFPISIAFLLICLEFEIHV